MLGAGANKGDSLRHERGRESRVFAQEAVSRMNGLRPALGRNPNQFVDVEVCLGNASGAEGVRLAGRLDMQRVPVRLGVDRHAGDAHRIEGSSDAYRDLAAVGDKDLVKHGNRLSDASPRRQFDRRGVVAVARIVELRAVGDQYQDVHPGQ